MHSEDFCASPSPPSLLNVVSVVNVLKHVLKFTRLLIVDMAKVYCPCDEFLHYSRKQEKKKRKKRFTVH